MNSCPIYFSAIKVGTEMLEIDCQRTKDGHVVVAHDNNLQRLTGQGVLISETLLKDLPLIRERLPVEFNPGECKIYVLYLCFAV